MKAKLESPAYPPDAEWFWSKIQESFLSFSTPKAKEDEFLMTQNAYSVFEGPNDTMWTGYHAFAPITPRLMMVTRSNSLRRSSNVEHQSALGIISNGLRSKHGGAGSCLEDLPVTEPDNNYSRWFNGQRVLSGTKMSPDKHIFYFKLFAIRSKHVQRINTVLLEEAIKTETLSYKLALVFYARWKPI